MTDPYQPLRDDWTTDREQTVIVITPSAITKFFSGFMPIRHC